MQNKHPRCKNCGSTKWIMKKKPRHNEDAHCAECGKTYCAMWRDWGHIDAEMIEEE